MYIDEIIKDLYFGMFRPYDLGSVQAQAMLNSILESMPDAWNDRQPELKAMNPEGWEIAMVCWSSLECFSSDEYFVDSQKEVIAPDQVYDFFWSLPWEIITHKELICIENHYF